MKENPSIDIRYTRALDSPYLKKWLTSPEVYPFIAPTNEEEMARAINMWMFFCRLQSSLTATDGHAPCGMATLYLFPYKKVKHHSPFKICVDPAKWHQGVGGSLIKNLKHLAKNYFKLEAIHTEVYGDNPLIEVLKKADFKEFMHQKNYVKKEGKYLSRTALIYEFTQGEDL